jgi:hypothetical protein
VFIVSIILTDIEDKDKCYENSSNITNKNKNKNKCYEKI